MSALTSIWSLLESPHAITASCIISLLLTSVTLKDAVKSPLSTTFWTLLGGGIAGSLIEGLSQSQYSPHVAIGILGITSIGVGARFFGYVPDRRNKSWISININTGAPFSQNRISYTAHKLLDNYGPTIEISEPLTANSIDCVLRMRGDLNSRLVMEFDIIKTTLQNAQFLDQVSGVFIHGADEGYVLIKGPNKESKHVISIRI